MKTMALATALTAAVTLAPTPVAALPSREPQPMLALTFDDLPEHGPLPPGETPVSVIGGITTALKAAGAPPTYGFVNAGNFADGQSAQVLAAWRAAGFPLGNHGWSHASLAQIPLDQAAAEITRGEPTLSAAMSGADWHWFRYPFLSEGSDAARVAALRKLLGARGYKVAAVTMSFGDYAWNAPYARCTVRKDTAAITMLEDRYLAAARSVAERSRAMSHAALGRDIPYVLLMHVGAFDARMLPRLIALYRDMGFRARHAGRGRARSVLRQRARPHAGRAERDAGARARGARAAGAAARPDCRASRRQRLPLILRPAAPAAAAAAGRPTGGGSK